MQAGYAIKSMVIVLSSFAEVLYLDSDNIPVINPDALFSEAMYQKTGTLFWHDFWAADWAPDAPLILGVNATQMPQKTVESGQMLLNKHRCDLLLTTLDWSVKLVSLCRVSTFTAAGVCQFAWTSCPDWDWNFVCVMSAL